MLVGIDGRDPIELPFVVVSFELWPGERPRGRWIGAASRLLGRLGLRCWIFEGLEAEWSAHGGSASCRSLSDPYGSASRQVAGLVSGAAIRVGRNSRVGRDGQDRVAAFWKGLLGVEGGERLGLEAVGGDS